LAAFGPKTPELDSQLGLPTQSQIDGGVISVHHKKTFLGTTYVEFKQTLGGEKTVDTVVTGTKTSATKLDVSTMFSKGMYSRLAAGSVGVSANVDVVLREPQRAAMFESALDTYLTNEESNRVTLEQFEVGKAAHGTAMKKLNEGTLAFADGTVYSKADIARPAEPMVTLVGKDGEVVGQAKILHHPRNKPFGA